MSLNKSPRNLRESPVRSYTLFHEILLRHSYLGPLRHFCLHDLGSHDWLQFAIWCPVSGRVVSLASRYADITDGLSCWARVDTSVFNKMSEFSQNSSTHLIAGPEGKMVMMVVVDWVWVIDKSTQISQIGGLMHALRQEWCGGKPPKDVPRME